MKDRETVIEALQYMISENCTETQFDYTDDIEAAIALLKDQEAKWIHREDLDFKDKLGCNHFHGMCENCGFIHDFIDAHTGQYKYCPQCGRSVKWE